VYTNSNAEIEISSQGTHQEEFRLTSSKVFAGAINVLTIRAGSDNDALPDNGAAAVVTALPFQVRQEF
jgi:hypothetical protein